MKSLPWLEYQGIVQPWRALYASSFSIGARETHTIVVSRIATCSISPSDISSVPAVQLGQPFSHSGSNMKCVRISCSRPSKSSSSDLSPSGPVKT